MTNPDNVGGLPEAISSRLTLLQIGTCSCGTKTPEPARHLNTCKYRAAVELAELCRAAPAGGDEKVARFGHHPDPAIDFEIEVESLQSRLFNAKHGLAKAGTQPETVGAVSAAIARAMEFRVGGDESAVRAKAMLRALQSDSAPAGSGEVDEEMLAALEMMASVATSDGMNYEASQLRTAAALLRKLQQGAESK